MKTNLRVHQLLITSDLFKKKNVVLIWHQRKKSAACVILRFYLLTVISPCCLWRLLKTVIDNKHNFRMINWNDRVSLRSLHKTVFVSHLQQPKLSFPYDWSLSNFNIFFFFLFIPFSVCEFVVVYNPLTSSIFDLGCMFPEMSCLVSQGKTLMSTWFNIKGRDSKNRAWCQRGNNIPINEKL